MQYRLTYETESVDSRSGGPYVYAEDLSRESLPAAIRERHIYGSTDNIVAEFTCRAGDRTYMLGDEFESPVPPTFRIKLFGTAPPAKITLVKDDVEIPLPCDSKAEIELSWTDPEPTVGKTSYYYVRGEQTDGELVWVSPMWIKYVPRAGANSQ